MASQDHATHGGERVSHGALVGWKMREGGRNLQLLLQTVRTGEAWRDDDIDTMHVVMSQQQAIQLANFLYTVAGTVPPRPARSGLMRRLLG